MGSAFIPVAAAEVGKRYMAVMCPKSCQNTICTEQCKEYEVLVTSRNETHTFIQHEYGQVALQNDIDIQLFRLK